MNNLNVKNTSLRELVGEYNAAARYLGETEIKKFADRETAERRVTAIVERAEAKRTGNGHATDTIIVEDQFGTRVEIAAKKPQEPSQTAPNPPASPPPGSQRWQRAKEEAPSRVAYRPRKGTQQERIYDLLTRETGTEIVDFCSIMNAALDKGKQPWTPSNTWSGLRYLFVANRGYGLSFDGSRLRLLVPKDERDAAPGGK